MEKSSRMDSCKSDCRRGKVADVTIYDVGTSAWDGIPRFRQVFARRRGEEKPHEGNRVKKRTKRYEGRKEERKLGKARRSVKCLRSCHPGGPPCAKRVFYRAHESAALRACIRRFKKQTTPYRVARSIRHSDLEARFARSSRLDA